jgi:nicotinate-nucleotide pyrophosphorylase
LQRALDAGATLILLDNMSNEQMAEAVAMTAGRAELEASGGVNLETVAGIAATACRPDFHWWPDQGYSGHRFVDAF